MPENPYYAAPTSIPSDAGTYRDEGRVEASPDGSSMTIWWEATLDDALNQQWRLAELAGFPAEFRKHRWWKLAGGIFCVTVVTLGFLNNQRPPDTIELLFRIAFGILGPILILEGVC